MLRMSFREQIKPIFMSTEAGRRTWETARALKERMPDLFWPFEAHWRYWTGRQELPLAPAPVFIGGTGGSGTRAVARILDAAGIFMGGHLNHAHDAMPTIRWYSERWKRYLASETTPMTVREQRRMDFDLTAALLKHRQGISDPRGPWGAKNPRFLYFLPHLHRCFPDMRFIHLVRDGRDMAFSTNQFQLQAVGELYVGALRHRLAEAPEPVRAIALWSAINRDVKRYGEAHLGVRYRCVRFEDLCARPRQTIQTLFDFLRCGDQNLENALREVNPPNTLARWRQHDPGLAQQVVQEGREGLDAFGYVDD